MPEEPRFEEDYEPRQVAAARRALVDVMQVLAAYRDSIVLVGGWVQRARADGGVRHLRIHRYRQHQAK